MGIITVKTSKVVKMESVTFRLSGAYLARTRAAVCPPSIPRGAGPAPGPHPGPAAHLDTGLLSSESEFRVLRPSLPESGGGTRRPFRGAGMSARQGARCWREPARAHPGTCRRNRSLLVGPETSSAGFCLFWPEEHSVHCARPQMRCQVFRRAPPAPLDAFRACKVCVCPRTVELEFLV